MCPCAFVHMMVSCCLTGRVGTGMLTPRARARQSTGRTAMGHVLSFAMQKGGVGKTTTTLNVGVILAEHGARVLLVDIDPQANLTQGLGIDPSAIDYST